MSEVLTRDRVPAARKWDLSDPSYEDKYKAFLSAGSSLSPMEILSLVDLDLTKKTPYEFAMREFGATLKELIASLRA